MLKKILRCPLFWIMAVCAFGQLLCYANAPIYELGGDTYSYTTEYDHAFRTPVYPYFAKVIGLFSGYEPERWFAAIAICQRIVFFVSIALFYKVVKMLTKKQGLVNGITLLYGLSPGLISWNVLPLTESLSIVEMVALLFFTVRYLKSHRKLDAILSGIIVLIMVMTRPAAIYLLAVYVVFWVVQIIVALRRHVSQKRMAAVRSGVIGLGIALVGVFAYACINLAYYGQFGISTVSHINKLLVIVDSGLYQKTDNAELRDRIQSAIDSNEAIYDIVWRELYVNYSREELQKFVADLVKRNRAEYAGIVADKTFGWTTVPFVDSYVSSTKVDVDRAKVAALLFPLNFGSVYVLIVGGSIWLIVRVFRKKRVDWAILLFVMLVGGNVAVTVLAAPYEPARLCVTSVPVIMAGAAYVFGSERRLDSSFSIKK